VHSIWRGAISFGLVHIPIRLYSASRIRELKYKMLHKQDLSEIRYARICKADGKEIPWKDIVKGYAFKEGDYAILTEEDFDKADPKKSRTIEISDFTEEDQIDTMYYDTPYYLEPEKGAAKAYTLLCEALKQSKKVAVGHFVFHHHEHLGIIRAHGNLLILHQLRYSSEIIDAKDLAVPKVPVPKKELDMALKLIGQLTKPFKASSYSDTYTDQIKAIIKKKSKGQRVAIKKEPEAKSVKVHDILSLLKSSIDERKKPKKRKAA
jgi:DNA end-binding protein Ku